MGDVAAFEIRRLDHVQLAMPAGGESDARAFYAGLLGLQDAGAAVTEDGDSVYVDDPFGNRMELLERSDTLRGPP